VSNDIRYDSLLVRELARELNESLAGARLEAAFLDRERLWLVLQTAPARRRGPPPPDLLWQLHPSSGHLTTGPAAAADGRVQLGGRPPVARVTAPADERIIEIELEAAAAPAGVARHITVELMTNQWNAVARAADGRIIGVLRERDAGARVLKAGAAYMPPAASGRLGAVTCPGWEEWLAALGPVPAGERTRALARLVAYTSPLNAAWIIGDAGVRDSETALRHALDRYRALVGSGSLRPVLRREDGRWQPYLAAYDADAAAGEEMPSLLAAFAEAAARSEATPAGSAAAEQALAAVARRLDALGQKLHRLDQERAGADEEAVRLRTRADLLLSQLHLVPRGAAHVQLQDFAGGSTELELDPALSAAENASRMYEAARRRGRAAARVPGLLKAAEAERQRLERLASRIREGTAAPADVERLAGRLAGGLSAPGRADRKPLPYREYRTSGGLEVRVGKGSRANDELTFRHSSPNDIWLHARDVAGAHVILRWPRADANPAAGDIVEAAVLAALFSRARTSHTVPVDWTRRKYVRKPRKAPPGAVVPERVRTVFVQPDAGLEEKLRAGEWPV
jgi:predicted ribosome quality control (RQC) complex YloA/Tae2 family protein